MWLLGKKNQCCSVISPPFSPSSRWWSRTDNKQRRLLVDFVRRVPSFIFFFLITDQLVYMFYWCKNKLSLCVFSMTAWPECVMSTFAELREETFPSSPSLLLHRLHLFFPPPSIWFMCCWLPPSPGLDPELPPLLLIWFEAVVSLHWKSPSWLPP